MVEIYGLKNCDTCRKALKALPEARLIDVRAEGVSAALLARALDEFGEKLLNTRSTTWRGLAQEEREKDPMLLLESYPALMKRPLIKAGETLFLGWSAQTAEQVAAAS
ncbi:ArsC/Spx/MgsR family protein [Sulfitobacter donghicola]|uniref:Arsenate reductase n=1 Tax=Sulfitobacter donghicola DSW-25 = KCTC 12864 = JCM 14565 TaxID=1300350 RepID=A0A073IHZ5_9RHOB|nr:ArsC/Spx/MgsR family protein [Sulfitobacter donghicola]KEJ89958.1 arsenate reductase [Sulfitobacter donghicola DSW-25 = KCTC 12864 = JCM 14565]KIN66913.1 ArsC family protein [Sulfitobacter donghicola DSW-25 = KCTC 12864 = JCM 14565]